MIERLKTACITIYTKAAAAFGTMPSSYANTTTALRSGARAIKKGKHYE